MDGTPRTFRLFNAAQFFRASLMKVWRTRLSRFAGHQQHETARHDASELVLQSLTRVRLPNGRVAIRGTALAEFVPGARHVSVYVGFCPPFEYLPKINANLHDDIDAELNVAQVLHNGAEFEVRLSEPAEEPVALTFEFLASEGSAAAAVRKEAG